MDNEQYFRVKFGQGILEDTKIFTEKLVEADHIHNAVELVCGDWKWGFVVCINSGMGIHTFSDKDGKWAQVQRVLPPDCSCESIMYLNKEGQWYCAYCDHDEYGTIDYP